MRVGRVLTWLDLLVCAALAIPGVSNLTFAGLSLANEALGGSAIEAPGGVAAFFVNLAGLFGVLWNVVMLSVSEKRLHYTDLLARVGVVGLVVYHFTFSGLPPVFLAFVFTECLGGLVKLRWLRQNP